MVGFETELSRSLAPHLIKSIALAPAAGTFRENKH
jgi:hypothetical protein